VSFCNRKLAEFIVVPRRAPYSIDHIVSGADATAADAAVAAADASPLVALQLQRDTQTAHFNL